MHFLYARRVMPCGEHCPAWRSCPLGGGAADGGREMAKRPPVDRPTCPFEQAEYNAVVTDALRRTQNHSENAWGLHLAHQVALMTVLTSRAARYLATRPFIEEYDVYHGERHTTGTKPSVGLIAYEKLARELRRWTILLERGYAWISCDKDTAKHHRHRQTTDTAPDPDALLATATGLGGRVSSRANEGQPPFNDRGTEEHREGQTQFHRRDAEEHKEGQPKNENDVGAGPCARPAHTGEPDRAAPGGRPYETTTPDPSNPSDPWPSNSPLTSSALSASSAVNAPDLPDAFLAGTADRIHNLIATHAPELLKPERISDPPGASLRHILDPPPP